jgi:hypothetical protein
MNKIARYIQNYLIFGLPFVIACMVWETIQPEIQFGRSTSFITKVLWEAFSWNLMLWFVFLILFLIILIIMPSIREKTLKRLANLKERDEREEYITGKASRVAYISTLSLMIFFLFFSIFHLDISKIPKDNSIDNHPYSVHINLGFSLLNKHKIEQNGEEQVIFDSSDISLSNSATIFILLCWQLLAFNLASRKEQIKDML